jgi:hypothetical protein
MGVKKTVKHMAMGAILAGVAAALISMKDEKNRKKAGEVAAVAEAVQKKVAARAKRLGKLTKSAYLNIVDTVVAEFSGIKDLSDDELKELRCELRDGWSDIKSAVQTKPPAKKKRKS